MDPTTIATELITIIGKDKVLAGAQAADYGIDGCRPSAVAFPETIEEISQILALAERERLAVCPFGAGTKRGVGPGPERIDVTLSTSRLNQLIAVEADDLVVRAQGGLSLASLQQALSAQRLFVPLDPFDEGTVGGILATNASGPRRYRYRTPRDLVIGLRVVLATGEVAKFGGTTVKNVAGYDLRKLFVGSWGTLGIIVEANLRLWPLPESSVTVLAAFAGLSGAAGMLSSLLGSQLLPSAIELLDGEVCRGVLEVKNLPSSGESWLVMVAAEGNPGDVARETREIQSLANSNGANATTVIETGHQELWQARQHLHTALSGQNGLRVRASLPLAEVAGFINRSKSLGKERGCHLGATAHAGNGIVHLFLLDNGLDDEALTSLIFVIKDACERSGGVLSVETGPQKLKVSPYLIPQRTDYALMRRLKDQLDPNATLNPGRFLRGA